MWYIEFVTRMHRDFAVNEPSAQFADQYLPQWLGQTLVYGLLYGMGVAGLLAALWALFKQQSGGLGLLLLVVFTVILPIVYGPLTGFFINFESHCGAGMLYVYLPPLCALPTSLPAWLMYLALWVVYAIRQRSKRQHSLPPLP